MADLPVQPVLNYGQMLSSYGEGLATQENAATSRLSALAQVPQTQASTALTNAQTQGATLANQKTAAQIALLQSRMAPPIVNDQSPSANASGTSPAPAAGGTTPQPNAAATDNSIGSGDLSVSDGGFDPAGITSHAQQQFAVHDQWTPQELQQLQFAQTAELAGLPNMTANVTAQHNARIQTLTNQAQLGASGAYDQAYAVSSAPEGLAMATLKSVHPQAAAAIQKIADSKGWTPEQVDQYTRTYADEVGNAVHRYSGRAVEVGKDGVARDVQTNQPVLGGIPQGLTPEAHADLVQKANALTDTYQNGVTAKIPTWQAAGFSSPIAYVNAAAKSNGAAPTPPRTITGPIPGAAPNATPGAAPNAAPGASAPEAADPVLRQALADLTYKYTPPKIPAGQAMDPDSTAKIAATNDARKALLQDSQDATTTASQTLTYLNAAKTIMDNKGAIPAGLGAETKAYISQAMQATGITQGDLATRYQELGKYLGNAALNNAKATYGQRMTQSEVGLQLHELSPSTTMTPTAVSNLINTNLKSAQYTIDSAQRTRQYLASGGDPQQFSSWNEKYYPRAKIVNAAPAPTAPTAAINALRQNPGLAAQFKAKYGYVPQ